MKNSAITRIILFSVILVLLIGILGVGIWAHYGSYLFDEPNINLTYTHSDITSINAPETLSPTTVTKSTETTGEPTTAPSSAASAGISDSVPAEPVLELEILWVAGSVTIQPGDTQEIVFSETGSSDKPMVWRQTDKKLVIQFMEGDPKLFGQWVGNGSKDLTVTVPRDWKPREIDVDSVSANVTMSDLTASDVEIDSVSGVCDLRSCIVDNLSTDSVSGNVQFTGSLGSLDCSTVSANCSIVTDRVPQEIELDCMSGDIELTLPQNAGFSVKMDGLKNNINSDFPISKTGGVYVSGDGSCQISMDSLSGELTIHQAGH